MGHAAARLRGYEDVVAASGGDPHARWGLDPHAPLDGATRDGAVVWSVRRATGTHAAWATALGRPAAVAALVADLLDGTIAPLDPSPAGVTVPYAALALLPDAVRPPEHGDWTWWWTDAPPPSQDAEPLVEVLDLAVDGARDELVGLLAAASPTASADPDDPGVRTWCGLREPSGLLVASAADRPYVHGVPHLASIATLPSRRGRGYGGAVTAWLTRRRLVDDEAAVVSLGMYSGNDPARSVYLRLGFRPEHRFASGALPAR